MANDDLQFWLDYDPLREAEEVGGHRNDLGFMFLQGSTEIKNELLAKRDDTLMRNDLDRYVRIITELGFEKVLVVPFKSVRYGEDGQFNEELHFWAHRDGILLRFDTYETTRVNASSFYYAWKDNGDKRDTRVLSSGHWIFPTGLAEGDQIPDDAYWYGDHDGREAIRHYTGLLRKHGSFFPVWPKQQHPYYIWCCHHADLKDRSTAYSQYEYQTKEYNDAMANAQSRLTLLPDWVQQMIGLK